MNLVMTMIPCTARSGEPMMMTMIPLKTLDPPGTKKFVCQWCAGYNIIAEAY